jgi:hypothetical protein
METRVTGLWTVQQIFLTFLSFYLPVVVVIAVLLAWALLSSARGRDAYKALLATAFYEASLRFLSAPSLGKSFGHFIDNTAKTADDNANVFRGQDDYDWQVGLKKSKEKESGAADRKATCEALNRVSGPQAMPTLHTVIEAQAKEFVEHHKGEVDSAASVTELRETQRAVLKTMKRETSDKARANGFSRYRASLLTQLADYVGRGTALGFLTGVVISSLSTAMGNQQVRLLDAVSISSMVGGILGTIAYTFFLARVLAQCREELTSSGRLAWLESPWIASVVIPILLAVLGVVLQQVPEA